MYRTQVIIGKISPFKAKLFALSWKKNAQESTSETSESDSDEQEKIVLGVRRMGGGMLVCCLICPTHLMKCISVRGLCMYKRERESVSVSSRFEIKYTA